MTEEALMKLTVTELLRQGVADGWVDDDELAINGPVNLRELARAILAAVEAKLPLVDLGKGDKLP